MRARFDLDNRGDWTEIEIPEPPGTVLVIPIITDAGMEQRRLVLIAVEHGLAIYGEAYNA